MPQNGLREASTNERLSIVETDMASLKQSMASLSTNFTEGMSNLSREIRNTNDALTAKINATTQPNYSLLVGLIGVGIVMMGGLWGIAIKPVSDSLERQMHNGDSLSIAVVEQDKKISALGIDTAKSQEDRASIRRQLDVITEAGSPITDKRLALLEFRVDQLVSRKP